MPFDLLPQSLRWAGLTDPETGELRSVNPSDALYVAGRVELEDGLLSFDWSAPFGTRRPPPTLLERFLHLQSDEDILKFAKKFGPLAPRGLSGADINDYGPPDHSCEHRELLSVWRRCQSQFSLLLALVATVREGQSPTKETFVALHQLGMLNDRLTQSKNGAPPLILQDWENRSLASRAMTARAALLMTIGRYVIHCGLRPALTYQRTRDGARMNLVFQDARSDFAGIGLSLFGALTGQLMSAATGSNSAVCSACGNFFVPRRRHPAFGKRRYCSACGRTAALKDAKADYRARLRAKDAARRRTK